MKIEIPKSYFVGGQEIKVKQEVDYDRLGTVCVYAGELKLANTHCGKMQTQSSKENTFFHELVHSILETMGEYELTENEKFVSCFSGFLLEALKSAK